MSYTDYQVLSSTQTIKYYQVHSLSTLVRQYSRLFYKLEQGLLNMDLYWITVVLLVTRMVNALNLTSNSQHSEIVNLKQEVNDLTNSVRNLTSALNSMQSEFQRCMYIFLLFLSFIIWVMGVEGVQFSFQ